jgi:hypothetical protein
MISMIQPPPLLPRRPGLLGDIQPPRERATWTVRGVVVDSRDQRVPDVRIKFVDKDTNAETFSTHTDVNGQFTAKVVTNGLGYRVIPCLYPYAMCPGHQDICGNAEVHFRCFVVTNK